MPIVSFRLSDDEHQALMRRAGTGKGAISKLIRRLIAEPAPAAQCSYSIAECFHPVGHPAHSTTTTAAPAFALWSTGDVGQTLTLRSH